MSEHRDPSDRFETITFPTGEMARQCINVSEFRSTRGITTSETIHQAGGDTTSTIVFSRVIRTGKTALRDGPETQEDIKRLVEGGNHSPEDAINMLQRPTGHFSISFADRGEATLLEATDPEKTFTLSNRTYAKYVAGGLVMEPVPHIESIMGVDLIIQVDNPKQQDQPSIYHNAEARYGNEVLQRLDLTPRPHSARPPYGFEKAKLGDEAERPKDTRTFEQFLFDYYRQPSDIRAALDDKENERRGRLYEIAKDNLRSTIIGFLYEEADNASIEAAGISLKGSFERALDPEKYQMSFYKTGQQENAADLIKLGEVFALKLARDLYPDDASLREDSYQLFLAIGLQYRVALVFLYNDEVAHRANEIVSLSEEVRAHNLVIDNAIPQDKDFPHPLNMSPSRVNGYVEEATRILGEIQHPKTHKTLRVSDIDETGFTYVIVEMGHKPDANGHMITYEEVISEPQRGIYGARLQESIDGYRYVLERPEETGLLRAVAYSGSLPIPRQVIEIPTRPNYQRLVPTLVDPREDFTQIIGEHMPINITVHHGFNEDGSPSIRSYTSAL